MPNRRSSHGKRGKSTLQSCTTTIVEPRQRLTSSSITTQVGAWSLAFFPAADFAIDACAYEARGGRWA